MNDESREPRPREPRGKKADDALLARLEMLVVGRVKLGLEGMQALLPKPLKLEITHIDSRLGSGAQIVAVAEGYRRVEVWEAYAAEGKLMPDHNGLNPEMAFAEPAIERFFQTLAEAIAEHDGRGWENDADRERRRAIAAYREMLGGS